MTINLLSNPKIATGRGAKPLWYRFYAMFSEDFARQVVDQANLAPGSLILDGWLGAGTTAAVSAGVGYRVVGFDINPAMIAISSGRTLWRTKAKTVLRRAANYTPKLRECATDDPLLRWFSPASASALRAWQIFIDEEIPRPKLVGQSGYAYTALFDTARRLALGAVSKNPTWIKNPPRSERVRVASGSVSRLFLSNLAERLDLCLDKAPAFPLKLRVGDSTNLEVESGSVDFILTSPPYCTRIDYAVMTSIELAVLGIGDASLAALRDMTMGTSTIRQIVPKPNPQWGSECVRILDAIANHTSKSSRNYYFKNFLQYFSDLFRSLQELDRCLRDGGQAVLVVQDSLYKGLRIDLAQITVEMAHVLGWDVRKQLTYSTTRTMRRVNTRSRAYHFALDSSETVIWFDKL